MADKIQLTAAQQSQLQAAVAAIDWRAVDWAKVAAFIAQIIAAILAAQPKQAKALEHCSHEECCLACVVASGEAFEAALHCYQTCQEQG